MGWGKGKGHRAAVAAVEGALVGGAVVAGAAAVATVASRPRPAPRTEVVVVQGAAVPASPAPTVVVASHGKGKAKGKGKGKGKWKGVAVTSIPPLSISAIGIPASGIESQGDVTYFTIDVLAEGSATTYQVRRRYREFAALLDNLQRSAPGSLNISDFPPKYRFFACTGERLENRRLGLERWLKRALNDPNGKGAWCLQLRNFLEVGQVHTLPDVAPLPPASAPASAPCPEPAQEDAGQILQITVPEGVLSGQGLAVTVPDGRQLAVTLPAGYPAGSLLEVWFEPGTGTLSPLV